MSVVSEVGTNIDTYRQLSYVEMLELLCRVAYYVSKRIPAKAE